MVFSCRVCPAHQAHIVSLRSQIVMLEAQVKELNAVAHPQIPAPIYFATSMEQQDELLGGASGNDASPDPGILEASSLLTGMYDLNQVTVTE